MGGGVERFRNDFMNLFRRCCSWRREGGGKGLDIERTMTFCVMVVVEVSSKYDASQPYLSLRLLQGGCGDRHIARHDGGGSDDHRALLAFSIDRSL